MMDLEHAICINAFLIVYERIVLKNNMGEEKWDFRQMSNVKI